MSAEAQTLAAGGESCKLFAADGCTFDEVVPTIAVFFPEPWVSFDLPLTSGITKYTLLLVLSVLVVLGFWHLATRKASVVPGRLQGAAEMLIDFVGNQVVRQQISAKHAERYIPLMVSLFLFIFVMNLMAIIPGLQLPVTSHLAYPAVLALFIYIMWNYVGIKKHGAVGHFVGRLAPSSAPKWILPILVPIELISNFVFRPFTHAVRPFAAMLSGHLMLAVFAAAGFYMFNLSAPGLLSVASVGLSGLTLVVFVVFTFFELFIMALQAYIFIMLASSYIGEALEGAH